MSLLDGINFMGVTPDGAPIFDIIFNIPNASPSENPISDARAENLTGTFGDAAKGIDDGQADMLFGSQAFARAFTSEFLPISNKAKVAMRPAIAAIVLNGDGFAEAAHRWERQNFKTGRDANAKKMPYCAEIYEAVSNLVEIASRSGCRIRLEPQSARRSR